MKTIRRLFCEIVNTKRDGFIHIHEGYFTGTRVMSPSASEETLEDIVISVTSIYNN